MVIAIDKEIIPKKKRGDNYGYCKYINYTGYEVGVCQVKDPKSSFPTKNKKKGSQK